MSNCLLWAFKKFIREGGYVVFMKSRYGWWFHVVWSPDLINYQEWASPRKASKWSRYHWWVPPILFKGIVRDKKFGTKLKR